MPNYMHRLMAYTGLARGLKLGPEDAMAYGFANDLRKATLEGHLRAVWTHPANELANGHRTGVKSAIARALGMHTGTSDYLFLWSDGSAALEAKSPDGSLSPSQRDFRDWCNANGVPFYVFKTAQDGLNILRGLGVLVR